MANVSIKLESISAKLESVSAKLESVDAQLKELNASGKVVKPIDITWRNPAGAAPCCSNSQHWIDVFTLKFIFRGCEGKDYKVRKGLKKHQ